MRGIWVWLLAVGLNACGGVADRQLPGPSIRGGSGGAGGSSGGYSSVGGVAAGGGSGAGVNEGGGGQYIGSCRPDCGPRGGGGAQSANQPVSDVNQVWPSSGCGLEPPAEQLKTLAGTSTGFTEFHIAQTGATLGADQPSHAGSRKFFVRLPPDYDKNRPYRVVYSNSACSGPDAPATSGPVLYSQPQGGTEQAIYVVPTISSTSDNPNCFDTQSGPLSQEWEAFDLIQSFVESHYCADNNRVFVTGYSSGATLANMLSCYFGGHASPPLDDADVAAGRSERKFLPKWGVRGHVALSGLLGPEQPAPCNGPSAGLWLFGMGGNPAPVEQYVAAFELALKTNGCTGNYQDGPKEPWAPADNIPGLQGGICYRYTGCPAEVAASYPLVACTTQYGSRGILGYYAPAVTAFLAEMDPKP